MSRIAGAVLLASLGPAAFPALAAATHGKDEARFATYANPVDLPYRYQPTSGQSYREAADPTVVRFRNRYWLFASHSQGYWWSTDLLHWTFVPGRGFDLRKYAPTVVELGGKLYLAASQMARKIWVTDDPASGMWRKAASVKGYVDPDLFLDDDGRLYMYDGLSPVEPLHVHQLDPNTFQPIGSADIPEARDKERRGWQVLGDTNQRPKEPSYIEGSWMTKYRGRYYLQFATPGTEYKAYADGVLVSDKPMGPFAKQRLNPFSVKPTGFITGAGHGSTFRGPDGRWWHAATMTISIRHNYERRLGLFPARFTRADQLVADTYLGDYPHYIGGNRGLTGWMLLSRRKPVSVSSSLDGHPAGNAVDEDVRTWWSAATGQADEWFQIDLGGAKTVQAVQINFADQDSTATGISQDGYRYALELSSDGKTWRTVIDHSASGRDSPHDYEVLPRSERARYIRLRNMHSPDGGKFSLYDLRVFGNGKGTRPGTVASLTAERDGSDRRRAHLSWKAVAGAEFYVVRIGPSHGPMNQPNQVYDGQTAVDVASLDVDQAYCFAVDAVNENGISRGSSTSCFK